MLRAAALKPRKQNAPRPAWKVADAFAQWIRGRSCYIATLGGPDLCKGKVQHCHVYGGGSGTGTKGADTNAIPLCAGHHREQHDSGWQTFERRYRFNGKDVAAEFFKAWLRTPMGVKWLGRQG